MSPSSSSPLPGEESRAPDFFNRRNREQGGSTRSYSPSVSKPAHVRVRQQRIALLVAVTLALPPVGVICLWRGGFLRLPIRVAATGLAFLLLILYFYWIIPARVPEVYQPTISKPSAVTEYSPSSTANIRENFAFAAC